LKNALAHEGVASINAVLAGLFADGLDRREANKVSQMINNEILPDVNFMSRDDQKKEFEQLKEVTSERDVREGLSELPNAKKGVVMRIAPSPSGALHVGSALTAAISIAYVNKYGGKFICRIEDTNPENIYGPAYELIEKDIKWLAKDNVEVVVQSDRMELYYDYAKKLIEKGAAYVCTCSADDFRRYVNNKEACPCRKLDIKRNEERWGKMFEVFKPGEAVLRFKSDIKHPNPAMRDFPLARINETLHPRQKKKYRVWPLMNLSVSVDDIEMGMTHIIRAKEHRDNAERQKLIFEVLGEKYPWSAYLGRLHLKGMRLSASQITKDVEAGKYTGWDDEKLPTLQALAKKGYKPEAFWKFAEKRGLSEADRTISEKDFFELLDTFNAE
jgi:glutamyl-tRNA synthetase